MCLSCPKIWDPLAHEKIHVVFGLPLPLQNIFIVPLTLFTKPTFVIRIASALFFKIYKGTGYNTPTFYNWELSGCKRYPFED